MSLLQELFAPMFLAKQWLHAFRLGQTHNPVSGLARRHTTSTTFHINATDRRALGDETKRCDPNSHESFRLPLKPSIVRGLLRPHFRWASHLTDTQVRSDAITRYHRANLSLETKQPCGLRLHEKFLSVQIGALFCD